MKTTIFKLLLSASLLLFSGLIYAQAPSGYYTDVKGKNKAALKTAFYQIIKNPSVSSYDGLWNAFKKTDKKPNGKVWDMYSDVPGGTPPYEYTFGSNQCGNYSDEGSCYNREHSFPKSWFDDAKPMYSDIFHLYPTDGKVNGQRGNYPFGNVGVQNWKSKNGTLRGQSAMSGYSGVVFEPIDEYKGDFARTYFYMVTCYQDKLSGWNSPHLLSGTSASYPSFNNWSITFLLEWSRMDPVSQKEIDRNNEGYNVQGNRNPFIDFPGLEEYIWGNKTEQSFDPDGSSAEPEIVLSNNSLSFSASALNEAVTNTINVKAANLTGALTVAITGGSEFTAPVAITKPDAESGGGYNLTVSYRPTAYGSHSATLQISGGGLTSAATVLLNGTAASTSTPEIVLSTNSLVFSTSELGVATSETLNIKASGLTGDLTVLIWGATEFTSLTKVAKADAEQAGGYNLQVNYLPTAYGSKSALLRVYGGGALDVLASLNGKATEPAVTDGNLLENPSFEYWTGTNALPWSFDAGTNTAVEFLQETSVVKNGSYAVKVNNPSGGATANISQSYSDALSGGDEYTLSFDYYVVSGDNSDARIWSGWKSFNGTTYADIEHDWSVLRHGGGATTDYLPSNIGEWSNYFAVTTVPQGAAMFDFKVRTYKGSVVIFDNFLLEKKAGVGINDDALGAHGLSVYATPGCINVDVTGATDKYIEVYNTLGVQIAKVKAVQGVNRIEVEPGQILFVKAGNRAKKIVSR